MGASHSHGEGDHGHSHSHGHGHSHEHGEPCGEDLSGEEREKQILLDAIFMSLDADGNGVVDKYEVLSWIQAEQYFQRTNQDTRGTTETLFANMDRDGNGLISKAEFDEAFSVRSVKEIRRFTQDLLRYAQQRHQDQMAKKTLVDNIFLALDADKSGSVSPEEFQAWFDGRSAMATSMFAELDANDDGVITEDEFWGVFRELPLDRIQEMSAELLQRPEAQENIQEGATRATPTDTGAEVVAKHSAALGTLYAVMESKEEGVHGVPWARLCNWLTPDDYDGPLHEWVTALSESLATCEELEVLDETAFLALFEDTLSGGDVDACATALIRERLKI